MDRLHELRLGDAEKVVAAFEVAGMGRKPLPPEPGLVHLVELDHRAHRAVENGNAGLQNRFEWMHVCHARSGPFPTLSVQLAT